MLGIGWTELALIAIVLLIFLGPRELPGMMRKISKIIYNLKSAGEELRTQMHREIGEIKSQTREIHDIGYSINDKLTDTYTDIESSNEKIKTEIDSACSGDIATAVSPEKTGINKP